MIERIAAMVLLGLMIVPSTVPSAAAEKIKVAHHRLLPPFAEVKDGKQLVKETLPALGKK